MSEVWEVVMIQRYRTEEGAMKRLHQLQMSGHKGVNVRKVNPDAVPVADPE